MNFKYKSDGYVPKPGDVIQRTSANPNGYTTEGKLYLIGEDSHYTDNVGDKVLPRIVGNWNTIQTKPGSEAKQGDLCMVVADSPEYGDQGDVFTVVAINHISAQAGRDDGKPWVWLKDVVVLCQEEPTTEPAEPEFTYPIYKKWKRDGSVFKFISINEVVCIVPDDTRFIGSTEEDFAYHTSASWEDFDPTSPEGYDHQYNYFKSKLDEIDLSFLVHNDIVVKTFGSIPLAQAIVDRAHECGGYDPGDVSNYEGITGINKCVGSNTSISNHSNESWFKDNDYTILTWEELLSYEDSIEEPKEVENPCTEIPATYGKPYIIPQFNEIQQQLTKEEPMTNPLKKGDLVRVITAGSSGDRVVGAEHIVISVDEEFVCYKIGLSAHFDKFELVTKAEDLIEPAEPEDYIEVGSTWERREDYRDESPAGELVTVIRITSSGDWIQFNGYRSLHRPTFLQKFKLVSNPSAPVATTETSETTAPKENNMNNSVNFTDARPAPKTLQDLLNEMFGAQLVTDLKNKPATLAMVFDSDEDLVEIIALPNDKAAIKLLQNNARKYLDYTISTYSYNDTHSIQFPVSSEKAELKAAKKKSK